MVEGIGAVITCIVRIAGETMISGNDQDGCVTRDFAAIVEMKEKTVLVNLHLVGGVKSLKGNELLIFADSYHLFPLYLSMC